MSRDEHRRRIPTSEELECQGAVAPLGTKAAGGRRGLFGFLRVGRIRVSGDVAARKYVPPERRQPPPPAPTTAPSQSQPVSAANTFPADPAAQVSAATTVEASDGLRAEASTDKIAEPAAFTPRRIRIDADVRERRGLGATYRRP